MGIIVKKWDKTREPYDRDKVMRTLDRYGLTEKEIENLLPKIESRLYDGITTKKILSIIREEIDHAEYHTKKSDLRRALRSMKPAPDFEIFIQRLFRGLGYDVTSNRVIQGYCVTHEIDGVVVKDGKKYYIETKHHSKTHDRTPFIDSLAVKAKMDDIKHGYMEGRNDYDFDGAILICNTKMTKHADDYSRCVGIRHIGWNSPKGLGIERLIEESGVYPFTILPGLTKTEINKLQSSRVVTLDDILSLESSRLDDNRLDELKHLAKRITKNRRK